MATGRVVIIESDEWTATLLAKFLRDGGLQAETAAEARAGFDRARAIQPDCIVCSVNLPDIDGFWVARRVRAEPPPVGATPFIFLVEADDIQSRLQGLGVGGDVIVSKPFRADEITAQVKALVAMGRRLRQPGAPEATPGAGPPALQGDLAELSVSTVLTMLELERRTGMLRITGDTGRTAVVRVLDGTLVGVELDQRAQDSTELLREVLRWKRGGFEFRSGPLTGPIGIRRSISELLLQAVRREDETRRR